MTLSILLDMIAEPTRTKWRSGRERVASPTRGCSRRLLAAPWPSVKAVIEESRVWVPMVRTSGLRCGRRLSPACRSAPNYRLSPAQLSSLSEVLPDPLVLVGDDYEALLADAAVSTRSSAAFMSAACDETTHVTRPAGGGDDEGPIVLATSGTSAMPKAGVLSQDNLFELRPLTNLYAGRRVVYMPNFGPVVAANGTGRVDHACDGRTHDAGPDPRCARWRVARCAIVAHARLRRRSNATARPRARDRQLTVESSAIAITPPRERPT